MTRKSKNSKAKDFLNKYQYGGYYKDDTLMQNPYDSAPDLQTAQQQQIVQLNQPKNQTAYIKPNPANSFNPIPFIPAAINLGIGVKSLFDSFKQRKQQKQYERAYQRDLNRRMEESRTNDYYHTPYEYNWGNFQQGGELDAFLNYYNQKEKENNLYQKYLEQYYEGNNQMMENQWKSNRNQGIQSLINTATSFLQEGGKIDTTKMHKANYDKIVSRDTFPSTEVNVDKAKEFLKLVKGDTSKIKDYYKVVTGADPDKISDRRKASFRDRFREHQEGGEINEYNPKEDLYSPEYEPTIEQVHQDNVQMAEQDDRFDSRVENWLFDDNDYDYTDYEEVNQNYFNSDYSNVVDKIGMQESGGNYGAINPITNATGKYQFVPSHWAGQIKSFMGLPQSFSREQVMEEFRKNPQAQDQFMNYVTETIYKPEVEKLRPLAQKYGMDDNTLIRMMHYRGISDTKKRLETGNFEVSQSEKDTYKNPDILEYLNK